MVDATVEPAGRYSAFISYNHRDVGFARRLHRQLETYRLPRRLINGNRLRIGVSRRLKPIFRDRDELTANADLTAAVREAIAESDFLIVVCSPNSAASKWVGHEIEFFRALRGDGAIMAALIDGTTATAIHPALRQTMADGHQLQPLAADFRRDGDGARLALLKLIAVLAGVGLDALVQRDAQRRMREVAGISAATVAAVLIAAVLTLAALEARATAERERARGESLVASQLDMRDRLKSVGNLKLLKALNQGAQDYYRGQDLTRMTDAQLQQYAKFLRAEGEDNERRGKFAAAREQFEEARRTTGVLLAKRPDDTGHIFEHAQGEYFVGLAHWRLGNIREAEAAFRSYATLARRLQLLAPNDANSIREAGYAGSNLGAFALRSAGDTARAETLFATALADFKSAARLDPGNPGITIDIADGHAWLGDTARVRGDLAGATWHRAEQRRLLTDLLATDPRNAEVQGLLIGNMLATARIDLAAGCHDDAVTRLRTGHAAAAEMARSDTENVDAAKQRRIFELFLVRTWLDMPQRRRPASVLMAATLGECGDSGAAEAGEELAIFCTILGARLARFQGDDKLAQRRISAVPEQMRKPSRTLSERWTLNFSDEIERATANNI